MSHRVDFDGIHCDIFILLNIIYASQAFIEKHNYLRKNENEIVDAEYYCGWTKFIVSEKLLSISTRLRTILYICKSHVDGFNIKEVVNKLSISDVYYFCNKIIHVEHIEYGFQAEETGLATHWTGVVSLAGDYQGKEWSVEFSIDKYCIEAETLLSHLENEIDWHRIYKYDYP